MYFIFFPKMTIPSYFSLTFSLDSFNLTLIIHWIWHFTSSLFIKTFETPFLFFFSIIISLSKMDLSSCFYSREMFLLLGISFLVLIYILLVVLEFQWNNNGVRSSLFLQDCCFPMSHLVSKKMGNFVTDSKLLNVLENEAFFT